MSHTRGPWTLGEFDENGGYDCMTSAINVGPALLDGSYYGEQHCAGINDVLKEKMIADARLIAAAPELLEACKEFIRKVECGEAKSTKSYQQMKVAVSKAEQC